MFEDYSYSFRNDTLISGVLSLDTSIFQKQMKLDKQILESLTSDNQENCFLSVVTDKNM